MAHFAKMIDMAKTPEQVNKEVTESMPGAPRSATSIADNLPKYPYGLCITLESEQLEKLGIDCECEVGDMIHLCAMAKVTSVSSREKEGGENDLRIELQITHLASENEDEEGHESISREDRVKHRYGGGEEQKAADDAREKDYEAA